MYFSVYQSSKFGLVLGFDEVEFGSGWACLMVGEGGRSEFPLTADQVDLQVLVSLNALLPFLWFCQYIYDQVLVHSIVEFMHTIAIYATCPFTWDLLMYSSNSIYNSKWYLWLLYLMYGERQISWLPRVWSRELLEPSVTWHKKSSDVSFISVLCLVCEL